MTSLARCPGSAEPLAAMIRRLDRSCWRSALALGVQEALEHHRHDDERVDPVLVDRAQRRRGVEPALQDERRRERQAEVEVREAPGVEHRRGDHRPLARPQRDHVQERRGRVERARVVASCALRRAGRAAREDDDAAGPVGRRRAGRGPRARGCRRRRSGACPRAPRRRARRTPRRAPSRRAAPRGRPRRSAAPRTRC